MKRSVLFSVIIASLMSLFITQSTVQAYTVAARPGNATTFSDGPKYYCYARTAYYSEVGSAIPSQFTVNIYGSYWEGVYGGGMIALSGPGSYAQMQTTVPTTRVGVEFWGDTNDGLALVMVDGENVWSGDIGGDPAYTQMYVQVSDLADTIHTLEVHWVGPGATGLSDVGIWFFGIGTKEDPSMNPEITSVTAPDVPIEVGATVTYTVDGMNFDPDITSSISGPGAAVVETRYLSSTQLEVDIVYTAEASGATQTLTVTNLGGLSDSYSFSAPTFNAVLTITGETHTIVESNEAGIVVEYRILGTNFLPGVTCSISGPGVSVSSTELVDSEVFHATVVFATEAALKKGHDLTMSNLDGATDSYPLVSLRMDLTPVIESVVSPSNSVFSCEGWYCVKYAIVGYNFLPTATCSVAGQGTAVHYAEYESDTLFHVIIRYSEEAVNRKHKLTLTNAADFADSFSLVPPRFFLRPSIYNVTPSDGKWCGWMDLMDYYCVDYTVEGAGFLEGVTTCSLSKPGAEVYDVQYESETMFFCRARYYGQGFWKAHNLTLTNFGRIDSSPWPLPAPCPIGTCW